MLGENARLEEERLRCILFNQAGDRLLAVGD